MGVPGSQHEHSHEFAGSHEATNIWHASGRLTSPLGGASFGS